MKQFRSKSVGVQRKALKISTDRVKKVRSEVRELSMRNITGGEMPLATETKAARDHLNAAVDSLEAAEKLLAELERMIAAKGK